MVRSLANQFNNLDEVPDMNMTLAPPNIYDDLDFDLACGEISPQIESVEKTSISELALIEPQNI